MTPINGGVKLTNKTGPGSVSIDLNSGQVVIDSTCVAGNVLVRGVGKVLDESGVPMFSGVYNGGLTLINETVGAYAIPGMVWSAPLSDYTVAGTVGKAVSRIQSIVKALLGLS